MKTELELLADRVEQATGPDRRLDLEIAVALNRNDIFDAHYEWRWGLGGDEIEAWEADKRKPSGYLDPNQFCPRVTASLDAAMTLADGYGGEVTFFKDGTAKAFLWQPYPMAIGTKAATLALALTAAALRARAAQSGGNDGWPIMR